ncbi:MAG TPA: endopeptidase La [Thermomicrobiales bacterium]|jgi:ATP-dependent Lon protease|nr:endopeptidase La [Thermomicrobiales bacterium]
MSRLDVYGPRYPLLPLKNVVIFPRNVVTLLVGRPRSIQAVEDAMLLRERRIVVTAHRESEVDDPRADELHQVGTLAGIVSVERQQGNNIQVVLEGIGRVRIDQFDSSRSFFTVGADQLPERNSNPDESRLLVSHVQELASRFAEARGRLSADVLEMVQRAADPGHLADLLATQLLTDVARRQELLEETDGLARLEKIAVHLDSELDVAALEQKIKNRVREQIDKNQREYYLREQLKAIHDELGGESGSEIDALKERVTERRLPEAVAEKVLREIGRLERMPPVSAESTVVRGYIDTVLALPWHEESPDRVDLVEAERILEHDHHGLETVKERILDYLAVRVLTKDAGVTNGAQILCLLGPPGVGKTSLGRSIAEAMGRTFVRVSLGGVRDEAEIRGHRRTYIGAMAGRLIGAMKTAQVTNPVILLDEIDKMASDYRGDPTAAMLEVLDPEQNHAFTDHYLDAPYDLSKVLFIATANYGQQIPRPLRDRMEVIEVSGYTEAEKIEIAQRHLLPRQLTAHGLAEDALTIPTALWSQVVRDYTRESGVRGLERELATICRKVAREVVRDRSLRVLAEVREGVDEVVETVRPSDTTEVVLSSSPAPELADARSLTSAMADTEDRVDTVTAERHADSRPPVLDYPGLPIEMDEERLERYLGPKKYGFEQALGDNQVGVAIGLGTTDIGGEIIPVEVATMPGKGHLTITGQAGDVMQESARAALSYARSRADQLLIPRDFQDRLDLHIHLAEGAQPKDGPSAGITMATALISALTGRPVRSDTAMTGEITLRGRVLPIGGLKDKSLAAHRTGIRRLIAPADNRRDLVKVPRNIQDDMEYIFVSNMDEVIAAAILLDDQQVERLEDPGTPEALTIDDVYQPATEVHGGN